MYVLEPEGPLVPSGVLDVNSSQPRTEQEDSHPKAIPPMRFQVLTIPLDPNNFVTLGSEGTFFFGTLPCQALCEGLEIQRQLGHNPCLTRGIQGIVEYTLSLKG